MVFERVNGIRQLMFGGLSVRCSVAAVIWVLCVCAAGAGDVNSGSVGGVEESEPNDFFGVLEFRIAPQNASTSRKASALTAKEIGQCREDLAENGPLASMKRDDEFVWMKVMAGVKLLGDLIIEEYSGAEYLLVHNWPSSAMSSGINWGLESVRRQPSDNMGRPCVGFLLDHDGGDYFYSLTSSNIGEAVAIVVEGKVASTPSIASAVRRQGIITGDFSEEQIAEMVKVLRKEVRPVSSTPKPSILSSVRPYLIPTVIILLAVMVLGFLIYR